MDENPNSKVEKNRIRPGKKPGTPKTGGRKKGSINRKSVWLREQLDAKGFDWIAQLAKAYEEKDYPRVKLLQDLIPFVAPKIAEKALEDPKPLEVPAVGAMASISTADLLALAKGSK